MQITLEREFVMVPGDGDIEHAEPTDRLRLRANHPDEVAGAGFEHVQVPEHGDVPLKLEVHAFGPIALVSALAKTLEAWAVDQGLAARVQV